MKPISVGSISNTLKEIAWQLQGMLNIMDQEEQLVNLINSILIEMKAL